MDDILGVVFVLLLGMMCFMLIVSAGLVVLCVITVLWMLLGVACGIASLRD